MMYRKMRFSGLSVEINLKELETFLSVTIPEYCTRNQSLLITRSKIYGEGLAETYASKDITSDTEILNEIVLILMIFLDKSPRSLPMDIVKQVHTFIGFIKEMQQSYDEAIQSFLKVLWIETAKLSRSKLNYKSKKNLNSSKNNPSTTGKKQESLDVDDSDSNHSTYDYPENINISLTTHRLALVYEKNCNYGQATALLEKVLKSYKILNVKEHHRIYRNAKQSLSTLQGDFKESSSEFFPERRMPFSMLNNFVNKIQYVTVESIRNYKI